MTYKELLPWNDETVLEFSRFDCSPSFDARMYSGVSLKSEPTPKIYITDSEKRTPDFLSGRGTSKPIVIEDVMKFLLTSKDAEYFEFIKLQLVNYDKDISYYLLNVLEILDAFDWEKSDYDLFDDLEPGEEKLIRRLRKTVVNPTKTNGRNLFYLKDFPSKLFISEQLEKELVDAGFKDFRTLEI